MMQFDEHSNANGIEWNESMFQRKQHSARILISILVLDFETKAPVPLQVQVQVQVQSVFNLNLILTT